MSRQTRSPAHRRDRGFSLVEIMVGLVIGLLATLVIMQAYATFEGQKRSTTGSSDAQTNGNVALYMIERDARMAGYGMSGAGMSNSPLDCTTIYSYYKTSSSEGPIPDLSTNGLFPVSITDGGTGPGASDMVTLRFGTSLMGGVPTHLSKTMPDSSSELNVDSTYGCANGDLIILSHGSNCTLMQLTEVQDSALKLQHNPGGTPSYNPSASYQNTNGWPGYAGRLGSGTHAGDSANPSSVSCLGTWITRTYAVVGEGNTPVTSADITVRNLAARDSGAYVPRVADIVNIQAQYGVSSAANNNTVSAWVNADATATPGLATWAAPTAADRKLIKAVRIAVVARNGLLEKDTVTTPCTTAQSTVNNGPCAWDDTGVDAAPKIDLSHDADWQRYRYRVYETIIPLRNIIWAKEGL